MAALVCLHTSFLWVPQSWLIHFIKLAVVQHTTDTNYCHISPRTVKTDPFKYEHSITLQAASTITLFTDLTTNRTQPLYHGGRFNPLSWEQLTKALHNFLVIKRHTPQSLAMYTCIITCIITVCHTVTVIVVCYSVMVIDGFG